MKKVVFTDQSLSRLEDELIFLITKQKVPEDKAFEITSHLLERAQKLSHHPYRGQKEPYLEREGLNHRRLVEGNYKIVYYIKESTIFIIDFFNTRRNPEKMKG